MICDLLDRQPREPAVSKATGDLWCGLAPWRLRHHEPALEFVKDLNRWKGGQVMITSHDMDELEQLAGRIVMIDRGRIAFDGDFGALRRSRVDDVIANIYVYGTTTEPRPIEEMAAMMWRAAKGDGVGNVFLEQVPVPEPGPEEVLVRTVSA